MTQPVGEGNYGVIPRIDSIVANINNTNSNVQSVSNSLEQLRNTIQSRMSNCITSSPQRVNVEISNGTVTLKAGSTVIFPYGTEQPSLQIGDELNGGQIQDISYDTEKLFYLVRYDSDVTNNYSGHANDNVSIFVTSNSTLVYENGTGCFSGTSRPSLQTYNTWYDINQNTITRYTDSGDVQFSGLSFPICTGVLVQNTGVTKITNIYNLFGIMGSTVFANKNIKALVPNGLNSDGSLNSIEVETQYVTTNTRTWSVGAGQTQYAFISASSGDIQYIASYYFEQSYVPDFQGHILWYNLYDNTMYWQNNDNVWTKVNVIKVANLNNSSNYTDGKIDTISDIKNTFRYVDYNNHPQLIETYVNGTSWYRVYSDGFCEQGGYIPNGNANVTVTFLRRFKDTNYTSLCSSITSNNGVAANGSVGVKNTNTCAFINNSYSFPMNWECKGYIL